MPSNDYDEDDNLSLEFLDHNVSHMSNTPLTQGVYTNHHNNISSHSMNFNEPAPPPIYHQNLSTASLHHDNYYNQPIFNAPPQVQGDPFQEDYEMQYQGIIVIIIMHLYLMYILMRTKRKESLIKEYNIINLKVIIMT